MIGYNGLATAPADAPPQVQAIIAAGNKIASKPYRYGGGHGKWEDSGYDCSGSLSYASTAPGMLDVALDSTGFMSWGEAGKGQWVTVYAKGSHAYMVIAGMRFDTSGRATQNTRWQADMRSGARLHRPPPRRPLNRGQGREAPRAPRAAQGYNLRTPWPPARAAPSWPSSRPSPRRAAAATRRGPDYSLTTPPAEVGAPPIETPMPTPAPGAKKQPRPTQRQAERLRPVLAGWARPSAAATPTARRATSACPRSSPSR